MSNFDELPPDAARLARSWSSKGGKNGSHENKVKAGRLGGIARAKKYFPKKKPQPKPQNPTQ